MRSRYLFVFFAVILAAAAAGAQDIDVKRSSSAVLIPGDEIAGRAVGESEYDFVAIINEEGYIEVPFAKEPILAKCKTEKQLRTELTERLSTYLKNPQFSFRITNRFGRPTTTLAGEVNAPQQFVLMRKVTLLELIAFGGGPKEDTASGVVQVFRPQAPICTDPGEEARWAENPSDGSALPTQIFSLRDVQAGKTDSNPVIYPGDVVFVQRAAPVYIAGEVNSPVGVYMKEGGLTLTEAIGKVGGLRRGANSNKIQILRRDPQTNQQERIAVNYDLILKGKQPDVPLKPLDQIVVGVEKPGLAKQIMEIAVGAAKNSITAFSSAVPYSVIY